MKRSAAAAGLDDYGPTQETLFGSLPYDMHRVIAQLVCRGTDDEVGLRSLARCRQVCREWAQLPVFQPAELLAPVFAAHARDLIALEAWNPWQSPLPKTLALAASPMEWTGILAHYPHTHAPTHAFGTAQARFLDTWDRNRGTAYVGQELLLAPTAASCAHSWASLATAHARACRPLLMLRVLDGWAAWLQQQQQQQPPALAFVWLTMLQLWHLASRENHVAPLVARAFVALVCRLKLGASLASTTTVYAADPRRVGGHVAMPFVPDDMLCSWTTRNDQLLSFFPSRCAPLPHLWVFWHSAETRSLRDAILFGLPTVPRTGYERVPAGFGTHLLVTQKCLASL